MKKAFLALLALGVIVGLLRPVARSVRDKLLEHIGRMAAHCKQMAAQMGRRGPAAGRA